MQEINEELLIVEKLLDKKVVKGRLMYFVKWKDNESFHNTWELAQNLSGCIAHWTLRSLQKVEIFIQLLYNFMITTFNLAFSQNLRSQSSVLYSHRWRYQNTMFLIVQSLRRSLIKSLEFRNKSRMQILMEKWCFSSSSVTTAKISSKNLKHTRSIHSRWSISSRST